MQIPPTTADANKNLLSKIGIEIVFIFLIFLITWIRSLINEKLSTSDQNLLQNFIEWFAVFYTLVLSVIVGQGWNKYNKINNEIDREADSLTLLMQTGRMFENIKLREALVLAVERYAKSVLLLKSDDSRIDGQSFEYMRAIREFVVLLIKSDAEECLKSELLHQYNEAYDARGDRFDLIEGKLPNHTWFIFLTASLIWLWGFLWLEFNSPYFAIYILGSTAITIIYLLYLARSLNDPIKGLWKLKFASFENHLLKELI